MRTNFMKRLPQTGMVLITSLVILLVLTILGLAAIQNTSLEERMAGNLRGENIAFQGAEAALRAAEQWLDIQKARPEAQAITTTSGGPHILAKDAPETVKNNDALSWWQEWDGTTWANYGDARDSISKSPGTPVSSVESLIYSYAGSTGVALVEPRFVIEEFGVAKDALVVGQQQDSEGKIIYQVTAHGVDPGGRSEVILRSFFGRRY
jgi:type IV pilus assembly protein PilX